MYKDDNRKKLSTYLQNTLLTMAMNGKTTNEAWTRVKLNVQHLKVFRCVLYMHIPYEKRKKIDPKGLNISFVGQRDI